MATKEIYMNFLGKLLREHYKSIKETGSASSDSHQFITGYLTAARKLNAVFQKELNDYTDRIHYEVFNMTIEQRNKSLPIEPELPEDKIEDERELPEDEPDEDPVKPALSEEDELDIPAYKRKGVKLKF